MPKVSSRSKSGQAREAAEILINQSVDSLSKSNTAINTNMPINLHDSLFGNEEYLHETLAAGVARDGRISAVRRFFCLFITFDLLFTTLLWIICFVVSCIKSCTSMHNKRFFT